MYAYASLQVTQTFTVGQARNHNVKKQRELERDGTRCKWGKGEKSRWQKSNGTITFAWESGEILAQARKFLVLVFSDFD